MRHKIALTLVILTFLGAPTVAPALSCAPRLFTLDEAYEAADSIIVGLITECKEETSSDPWANGGGDCSFTSLEVLKESVPARDYSGVASSSGCGLSLIVGGQYLLFLDSKNQPMRFSVLLSGNQYQAQVANRYLWIIRDFRNGTVNDLAEPWMFGESDGYCSLRHSVRGNQISFGRRTADAPQQPKANWTQETINGTTVNKTIVPSYTADSKMPAGNVEIVVFGDVPDDAGDALMLRVSLAERSPAPVRQAIFSVGNRTWSLNRMEMNLSLLGGSAHKVVEYYGAGDVAEQILSAMAQPSDIVVSATVVASDLASAPPEVSPPDQDTLILAPSKDVYFGQPAPETSSTRPSATPKARAGGSYGVQEEPPNSVLRVESRSTQLSSVIQSFRACYAKDE